MKLKIKIKFRLVEIVGIVKIVRIVKIVGIVGIVEIDKDEFRGLSIIDFIYIMC